MSRPIISQRRERERLLLGHPQFWNFVFQSIRSGQNLPALCNVLKLSYNGVMRRINSSSRLRKRYARARTTQLSGIQTKWEHREAKIMRDHFEIGSIRRIYRYF